MQPRSTCANKYMRYDGIELHINVRKDILFVLYWLP